MTWHLTFKNSLNYGKLGTSNNFKKNEHMMALNQVLSPEYTAYIIHAFTVILATLVADFSQKKIFGSLAKKALVTQNKWDDGILLSISRPLSLIIWITSIAFIGENVPNISALLLEDISSSRSTIIIGALAWFLFRFIKTIETSYITSEKDSDVTTVHAISKLMRISVVITTVLMMLQTLGFSVSGVLAFGGVGGIAIGFAAQDMLSNFFGGLFLYLDRPFVVGDWIRSPDREIEGTVEKIGWRVTVIRTFDKRPLYMPNSIFSKISVENPSRMQNRRIKETIGIRYDDAAKMQVITTQIEKMLIDHSEIDTNKTLMVNFNTFAPSSLDFFIYTFTKTKNWEEYHSIKQDILLKIMKIIADNGAEIAFPTSTIYLTKPQAQH
uniref:Small-conductance mechanosensitive channel n=1 Tax=uncultured Desulfobacterales bacterium HF0200_07G10 TaxID=710741 RepID=E0XU27_9BACT|nr:small-conductance mechanosensitive channel [uncultured Desulfobacterales bacterium HF0200_07G10]